MLKRDLEALEPRLVDAVTILKHLATMPLPLNGPAADGVSLAGVSISVSDGRTVTSRLTVRQNRPAERDGRPVEKEVVLTAVQRDRWIPTREDRLANPER